ncbi:hypothetical protein C8Q79DRAFT_729598 [Trametes meyenii]|nr:hypothetical protein C8Q79DRAFT_729598 [Trametes meyenii]
MRTTALSALVLLSASLVSASPIRVIVTTHQEVSSNVHYGHALGAAGAADVAHLNVIAASAFASPLPAHTDGTHHAPSRRPCGSMRVKALEVSNAFRAMFGFPPIAPDLPPHVPADHKDGLVQIMPVPVPPFALKPQPDGAEHKAPILPFVGTPVRPAFVESGAGAGEEGWGVRAGGPPVHRMHRFHRHHGSFLRRVHHALMALGPWEGRAVAFVLGCGIGVLLRMVWVMVLVTARAIRGGSGREDGEEEGYEVVFDDEAELLVPPPQYTVIAGAEAVPVPAEEKSEKA